MRSRSLVGLVAGCALLAACEGLKEALTAHVDVVARAGTQELSVNRLGDLLGNAKIQVPVNRETAAILADIWTGYQQMAYAAACVGLLVYATGFIASFWLPEPDRMLD